MLFKMILLPFRIIGFVIKTLAKITKFLGSNLLGTLIVATFGFFLGMKYVEYQREKKEKNG